MPAEDESGRRINIFIFVAHSFNPADHVYDLNEFRSAVHELIEVSARALESERRQLAFTPIIEMQDRSERLSGQIRKQLQRCSLGIVDISDNNPNVLYELGHMTARGIPHIVIKSAAAEYSVPADIQDEYITTYKKPSDIVDQLRSTVTRHLRDIIRDQSFSSEFLYDIWFPASTSYIYLVSSSEPEKTQFAFRNSPNYMYIDNFGDKDTVLESMVFLAKFYPRSRMKIYASDLFDYSFIRDNLVVIGGPGDEREGNEVCKKMTEHIGSSVSYSDDCETMYCYDHSYQATYDALGHVEKDYGYFARFPNPFDPNHYVVLVHGIHTYGVRGALRAFSDHPTAQLNMSRVIQKVGDSNSDLAFECYFPVNIFRTGEVAVPEIDAKNIISLSRKS